MPLKVKCPGGCVIRMPNNRAGKLIRCPGCKSVLQIPAIPDQSQVSSSETVLQQARLAKKKQQIAGDPAGNDVAEKSSSEAWLGSFADNVETSVDDFPVLIETGSKDDEHSTKQDAIAVRVQRAKRDRIVLSRFFAFCLCIVAVINMVPAIYYWHQWSLNAELQQLPRWTYLQVFVAALHFVYAVYLVQISDWAALKTVCVVMGIVGAIFAAVSVGLMFGISEGGAQGNVARFLGLPYSLVRSACLWCVAMLCLSTLASYLSGREAANWQRIEQLVKHVLART